MAQPLHVRVRCLTTLASALLALSACEAAEAPLPAEGSPAALATLRLVSYPGATRALLQQEVGLGHRAAESIVDWREGPDGHPGTDDDGRFDSLLELGLLPGVDRLDVERLMLHALERGWAPGQDADLGRFDGVPFSLSEASATLAVANGAPAQVLDEAAGMYADAVAALMAARPLAHLGELAAVPGVGRANLERLKTYALSASQDTPPCPAEPFMTVAEAAAADFEGGQFTVCGVPTSLGALGGACPTLAGLDAAALIHSVVGEPAWSGLCRWEATPSCGPFAIGSAGCCYVVQVDRRCE